MINYRDLVNRKMKLGRSWKKRRVNDRGELPKELHLLVLVEACPGKPIRTRLKLLKKQRESVLLRSGEFRKI